MARFYLDTILKFWVELALLFITSVFLIYTYFNYKFSYWKRRGFPQVNGKIPCGSLTKFILSKISITELYTNIYREGKGHKYIGSYSFTKPVLVVRDLELIKRILVKDSEVFLNRGIYYNEKRDSLSGHLFFLDGEKWKNTRAKLTPSYTSGRMKFMYGTMNICAQQLKEYILESLEKSDIMDFRELIARHGVNVIANTAVGMEGHSLKDESDLCTIAFKATDPNIAQAFRFMLPMVSKGVAKLLCLRSTPKDVEEYYLNMTQKIVEYRTKNNIERNDFMHLLMGLWNKKLDLNIEAQSDEGLSIRDLAAQTFIFFLAAYESSSSTICFTLYYLAKDPAIQEKLIKEVDEAGENITYEKLLELPYLDMVLHETWRIYPPGGILLRQCTEKYEVSDGKFIEKGTQVIIPVHGLHRDPQHFPDPEKYDPERFGKSAKRESFCYLPFGDGPRFCIGKRFGIMQSKLTLFTIMTRFKFEITDMTEDPPKIDEKVFVVNPKGGMYLRVISRK